MGSLQKFWSAPRTGAEPEQPLWAGKTQICGFSEKKKKKICSLCKDDRSLAATLGRWWKEKEGSLARQQISAKGLRPAPPARKGKGCGWKGKQKWLGFAIPTPVLKVERAQSRACLPPEEEGPCPPPHHFTEEWGMDQDFHSYTSKSISSLEKETKAQQEAGF